MPFVKLKRAHKYSVSTKNALLVVVELLDQKVIECSVGFESLAQECLDIVLSRLQINEETFYFGLQHLNKQHRYRWLELDKSLRKQLARAANTLGDCRLRFGVMFLTPDMNCLQTRQTRLMFFLHFKRMITEGAITCSLDTACKLASYALQAENGDFNPMAHNLKFLQYYTVFPTKYYGNAPEELFAKVLKLYQERRGMSSEEAEMMYLNEIQQIEDYSVEYIRAKMEKTKEEVLIGTSPVGITLRSDLGDVTPAAPLHRQTASICSETSDMSVNSGSKEFISWSRIHRMLYKDCIFLIIKLDKSELKVIVESAVESRYFWVRSIGNHLIYRQSRLIGDGFSNSLNNPDTLQSNPAVNYGKSTCPASANTQHFDERKLLRGDLLFSRIPLSHFAGPY